MEPPPAKRRRLDQAAADVGSNLPFLDEGSAIDLHDLCRRWEEHPLDFKRPLVFFTVGRIAVLSSSSGVKETGSLCRQFWNWLGQPEPYRPDQIAFRMVDGRGIYMYLPNLTQFKVKFKHGSELESIITLSPTRSAYPQVLQARTVMTSDYPATAFRTCPWWGCTPEVLVIILATVQFPGETNEPPPDLYINGFYSKASDTKAGPSIKEQSEEDFLLRGAGRRLLCLMLDTIQWGHAVTLDAAGLSHRDEVSLAARARGMQAEDIMADVEGGVMKELKDLNPNLFEEWKRERERTKRIQQMRHRTPLALEDEQKEAEDDLEQLRSDWVSIRGNQNLVAYYMKTFGFRPSVFDSFTFVGMSATPEMIRDHCAANAEKDGDCAEIIVNAADADSQIESLRNCKNIRMLYLRGVQELPIVESLLPVTKCIGFLGSTSLSDLQTIEQLLTARQQLTVQIDCLCLDDSTWSVVVDVIKSAAWPRLFIRRVIVKCFDNTEVFYDEVMTALNAKTGAIYYKVSGELPYYIDTKPIDRAVRVKGEEMTDVGSALYDAAETKIYVKDKLHVFR